jgi:hypothetical protein
LITSTAWRLNACSGIATAQDAFATDWIDAYQKYYEGRSKPAVPGNVPPNQPVGNEFSTEAQAAGHCPSDAVVWPWTIEETDACFIVRDANGQALAYVYFENEPGRRAAAKLLTRDEARRIAANIAQLPELPAPKLLAPPANRPLSPYRSKGPPRPPLALPLRSATTPRGAG